MRAIVGELDGEIIAIGGIVRTGGIPLIFSDIKPEARKFKKDIVRGARLILALADNRIAIAQPWAEEENAPRFLEHLGFVPIGNGGYILRGKL